MIEAVADDEFIFDLESDIFHLHVDLAAARLTEQAGRSQALRVARAKDVLEIRQREAGVDDVFDDDDVAALKRRIKVFQQAHLARAFRGGTVARDGDEIERDRTRREGTGEVGEKHERTFQYSDEVQRCARGIRRVNFRCELIDADVNLFGAE